MGKTTIYVHTDGEVAETCFDVITHEGDIDTLERGVFTSGHIGDTAIAIVDSVIADQFIGTFNHAPGCNVTGHESH